MRKRLPPGLYIRGEKYWSCFSAGGRQIRKPLSTDLAVAKRMLTKLRMRHEAGDADNEYPFLELVEAFFRSKQLKPTTEKRYRFGVERFVDIVTPKTVADIVPDDAVKFCEERMAEGASEDTTQFDLDRVRQILRWGCRKRKIASNPLEYIDRIKTPQKADVLPFTVNEAESIIREAKPWWQDVLHVAFGTGMRKGELVGIRIEDVDSTECVVNIPKRIAKTPSSVRAIPMLQSVREILERLCRGREPGEPVFQSRDGGLVSGERAWRHLIAAARRAEVWTKREDAEGRIVERRDFHSTRRSFATWLREAGAEREKVSDLLGHRRAAVTDRYLSFTLSALRMAIGRHPWGPAAQPEGTLPITPVSHAGKTATQAAAAS